MHVRRRAKHLESVALIALGGIAGASLRYLLGAVSGEALLMTVAVNALGCFLLGMVLFGVRRDVRVSERVQFLFVTGFVSSFTTYSTFIADLATGAPEIAALYLIASYAAGFGAVLLSRGVVSALLPSVGASPWEGED